MDTLNSTTSNQKTNIIVITGDNEILQNLLSVIQKSDNRGELDDKTRHVIAQPTEDKTTTSCKRRRTDLTCLVCGDECSGFNFNVISCASCKSFFYRNMSQNVNDLKCLTNTNKCNIKIGSRGRMCRRCRLEKCLSVGMKRNSGDEEEKLMKQRQVEENRRLTQNAITTSTERSFMGISLHGNEQSINEPVTVLESPRASTTEELQTTRLPPPQNRLLTFDDYNRLNSVKLSYEKACLHTLIKHDISALNRIVDQRSALLYSMSLLYDTAMQVIAFMRNIPEFLLIDENDRFILAKYNTPLVVFIRICLNYDISTDLIFNPEVESEEDAVVCKQVSRYCYGEELERLTNQLFRSIKKITDNDPVILQLMIIIMTFVKGISVEDTVTNEELILLHSKQIYEVQSIYTSLLFRYMIQKHSSYCQAVRQYSQLIQKVLQMQMLLRTYQQFFKEQLVNTSDDEINPIVKSILHLD